MTPQVVDSNANLVSRFTLPGNMLKRYTMSDLTSILTNRSLCNHLVAVGLLFTIITTLEVVSGGLPFTISPGDDVDPWTQYGFWMTIMLYFFKYVTFFSVPMGLFNICGIVMFNTSPTQPKLMSSLFLTPFICFRVVTRGSYPELVKRRVNDNLQVCREIGLQNFQFEVVTDNKIGLKQSRVKEIVVPTEYKTKNGTLFKARALHYCWEPEVSIINDSDWVVHLDEETLMTEGSVIGIVNFISDGKYDFGQGVITYGKGKVVNWVTSLADSIRTGFDYGVLRFAIGYLHRPVFSWKGSFIVSRASAERQVGFDFGAEGSIAEDCYFALKAWSHGFLFDFVSGEMREVSPFTLGDMIRQRKRWMHGIYLTFASRNIAWRYKLGVTCMVWAWITLPFQAANIYFSAAYPVPVYKFVHFLFGLTGGVMLFLFFFGADKSFYRRSRPWPLRLFINVLSVLNIPLSATLELIAVVWQMTLGRYRIQFHIIQKEHSKHEQLV